MSRIPMPPTGVAIRKIESCLEYQDTLYIDFKDTGFFGSFEDGIFEPDLPTGLFFKNSSIGPFKPVKNDTSVDLFFLDMEKGRGYLDTVNIKTTCP